MIAVVGLVAEVVVVVLILIAFVFLASSVRVVNEWDRLLVLTLGRYSYTLPPGLRFVIPVIQRTIRVDLRVRTMSIPTQEVMTKDNVPVHINAVVYFKVLKPEDAIIKVQDYEYAVAQYAQTALRDVMGNAVLDEVLQEREKLAEHIRKIVEEETVDWGIDIISIKLQDIELPGEMKRSMARQAEAEREKRAVVIMSEGEVLAAKNTSKAAEILASQQGALHLRTLQTLSDISPDPANKIVIVAPVEVLEAFKKYAKKE